jgi:hypothetical protein
MLKPLITLILCLFMNPGTVNLVSLRQQLDGAANDKALAEKFNDQFKNVNERSLPILQGFKAISEMVLCKHVISPISKLSHFKKGKRLLESAIAASPENPELCFFRFTTQSNVPSLLNYSSDIQADKQVLINALKSGSIKGDPDLFKRIRNYMLSSKYCTAQEITILKRL